MRSLFLAQYWKLLDPYLQPLYSTWFWPGFQEVGRFIGTHLISGMLPAFFIAGAISVFLDKQRVTKYMGATANPLLSFSVAAISGGILTVCSCGVLPIFAGILHQGAGIGPAFTFLMASPAVNLISLMYTHSLLGWHVTVFRLLFVMISAVVVGLGMRFLFGREPVAETAPCIAMADDDEEARDGKILVFFALLVLIMLTSTGVFDRYLTAERAVSGNIYLNAKGIALLDVLLAKGLILITELTVLASVCYLWFPWAEIRLWLNKSYSLFVMIFPKVLLGIFISGIITALLPLAKLMNTLAFDFNGLIGNLAASVIGATMYFGTIVGVNIVSTLVHFGMHPGPAMALLLSGPAVSLPSALALYPLVGLHKTVAFLILIVLTSTISGLLYGMILQM